MLPDVIAVIAGVEHVSVAQYIVAIKKPRDIINKLIDWLKGTKSRAVELIIIFDLSVTLPV